jgi:hypothetical protein
MSADGQIARKNYNEIFSDEIVARICERVASGLQLKDALKEPGMPSRPTFYEWLRDRPGVADFYARAREDRADLLADEILEIADAPIDAPEPSEDDDDGAAKAKFRRALEQRRQQIDARKWAAAKMNPKMYADRTNLEHGGSVKVSHEQALKVLE